MDRLAAARVSLEGLSVGDAFGKQLFGKANMARSGRVDDLIAKGDLWAYTDDTSMALSIYAVLREHETIDQERLAASFALYFDHGRGYGRAMRTLLPAIGRGKLWRELSINLFHGQGSYGNGAAMRTAPIGAYFADDLDRVVEQARLAAEITHAHPEGIAGGIAVSIAAALAWRAQGAPPPTLIEFIDAVLPYVPESEVRSGIGRARNIQSTAVEHVVGMIGNGAKVSAQDTVPYTLWCAGAHLGDYQQAITTTASGLGDIDTNCAIVGGIVACYGGVEGIPQVWLARREPLPAWALEGENTTAA